MIFNKLRDALPRMSTTEQQALDAGTTWWDKELFSGNPDWDMLDYDPRIAGLGISDEAQKFLDNEVQALCEMVDDYETNQDKDLHPFVWEFLKGNRFFGMVIPEEYGGLGFNAREHSEVVMKIATHSIAAAVTVMVPNSLGPGELLMHYGTEEEREYYLPNLANGKDIPCFALTAPTAGSDASSIPDTGVVIERDGELGLLLTFDKRYITLAPVATLMGLAVKVRDPDQLLPPLLDRRLGNGENITVVLMPTNTPGVKIGRRHDPLNVAFMNGPIRGKDVFVPMSKVLGGQDNIGKGWSMLMECLSAGRAISLPSLACAGGKVASIRTGAYSKIRQQFRLAIGKFEGVTEKLAMIAGYTYIMDSTRKMTLDSVDMGERPSVLSAICKYHLTEMNREVIDAAMDIQGGSGICLGPQNYIGKSYQSIPVSITVEGANIMTRNLIIFGQGAIRNHPYAHDEMEALRNGDRSTFYSLLGKHVVHFVSAAGRALFHGLTGAKASQVTIKTRLPATVRRINRFSAGFAFVTDVAMMLLGGSLKRKERISARLGDILSYLYMLSAIHRDAYTDTQLRFGKDALYEWSEQTLLYKLQEAFYGLFDNFPVKGVGTLMRLVVFPYGRIYKKPSDRTEAHTATILLYPNSARSNLGQGIYVSTVVDDQTWKLENAFGMAGLYERAVKAAGKFDAHETTIEGKLEDAAFHWAIGQDEAAIAIQQHKLRNEIIQVDDFEEL